MTEKEIAEIALENKKLIFAVIKWVIIAIGVVISFWVIDVGKLKLEREKARNLNKQNLLNTYLQATETPNPDLWLRKLRLIKALSDNDMADMKLWAQKEEKYIKEVSALVVLYQETVKVVSILSNRDQYLSDEWKSARNRFYELYHGDLVFYKESDNVQTAMVQFKHQLEAINPNEDNSWDEMDQQLLSLVIVLSEESEKLKTERNKSNRCTTLKFG